MDFVSQVVLSATYLVGLVALVMRYRRGDEQVRRQLLWLLFATGSPSGSSCRPGSSSRSKRSGFPILAFATVALVPAAMAIAVLRHGLLDIRLVWSRALTYALLTAAVVVAYLALVEVVSRCWRGRASARRCWPHSWSRSHSTRSGVGCSAGSTGCSTATAAIPCAPPRR